MKLPSGAAVDSAGMFHAGKEVLLSNADIEALPEPPVVATVDSLSAKEELVVAGADTITVGMEIAQFGGMNNASSSAISEPLSSYLCYGSVADIILSMHEPNPEIDGSLPWIKWYDSLTESLDLIVAFS